MSTTRWFNSSQPQTLQSAVILFYINGVLALLGGLNIITLITIAGIAAGVGIASEKKWGYRLGVVAAILPLAFLVLAIMSGLGGMFSTVAIALLFRIVLVVLLLHPMSRQYQRIWFK